MNDKTTWTHDAATVPGKYLLRSKTSGAMFPGTSQLNVGHVLPAWIERSDEPVEIGDEDDPDAPTPTTAPKKKKKKTKRKAAAPDFDTADDRDPFDTKHAKLADPEE